MGKSQEFLRGDLTRRNMAIVGYNLLVICYIAMEAMASEIVDFPINSMVMFHSYGTVYQRVICYIAMEYDHS